MKRYCKSANFCNEYFLAHTAKDKLLLQDEKLSFLDQPKMSDVLSNQLNGSFPSIYILFFSSQVIYNQILQLQYSLNPIESEMLTYKKLNLFKRVFYDIKALWTGFDKKVKFFRMRQLESLFDETENSYSKSKSYRINWLNLQKQNSLAQWESITDVVNGGESTAQIYFDETKKCIRYEGYVETKDKDRMIHYPFINIMRKYPSYIKLGPMRLVQVQVKTDGKPLEIHFEFKSFIKGQVNIYGFILSKSTQWHTYEIPIQNMILRGTQQDYHEGSSNLAHHQQNFFSKFNQSSIFDKEYQSLKKIIKTEISSEDEMEMCNVGFRLVSTQNTNRHIQIKNVNFCYKKGYEKFVKSYRSPYFYITEDQIADSALEKEKYVEFLNNNLETKDFVDTGDIKYFRSNKNEKPSSKVI